MSLCGLEPLPDVSVWSEVHSECSLVVGRPSWMSRDPSKCPGAVKRPSRMSGSGRLSLPDVRECLGGPFE